MTRDDHKTFPYKPYDGSSENFEDYETDKDNWTIEKDYDEFLEAPDPSTIPRVTHTYTIDAAVHDDIHGPAGTRVSAESEASYDRRIKTAMRTSKVIYAAAMKGFQGDARKTALTAEKYNCKDLFTKIKEGHGSKTSLQVTKLVKTFIEKAKTTNQTIEKFNSEWKNGVRLMEKNGMPLPSEFVINLYLLSLGEPYRMIMATVQVMAASERTLVNIMQLAVDHRLAESDEAITSDMALIARMQDRGYSVKKRTHHEAFLATHHQHPHQHPRQYQQQWQLGCPICGKKGHDSTQCFAPGGGLGHMNTDERRRHIALKREEKEQRRQQAQQQKPTEVASLAISNTNQTNDSHEENFGPCNETNNRLLMERAEARQQVLDLQDELEEYRKND